MFKDGYAEVKLNKKYNFIDKNGEILSDEWFNDEYTAEKYFMKNKK